MSAVTYGFGADLNLDYEAAVDRVRDALKNEGFGVLTEIDVKRTMQEKLGEQIEPYIILGACNPQLAFRALSGEREIGLLLPCNVVVRALDQGSRVEIADPAMLLGIVGNPELDSVAAEAKQRLQRALGALRNQPQE